MTGTAIYTWHNGRPRYDQVRWDPLPLSREQAYDVALKTLLDDPLATRVHVDFGEPEFVEAVRPSPSLAVVS